QHACLVADALGMTQVMLHPLAGVLSAYGMGLADVREVREATVALPLGPESDSALAGRAADLETDARAELAVQGIKPDAIETLVRAEIKDAGTDTALPAPFGPSSEMRAAFETLHRQRFGFAAADRPLVVESLQVEAIAR